MSKEKEKQVIKNILLWTCIPIAGIILLFIVGVFIGIVLTLIDGEPDYKDIDNATIKAETYGDDYPYIIDNLTLKCDNSAVWVIDNDGNKYAVNGLAYSKLTQEKDNKLKGYTTEISKNLPNSTLKMSDEKILEKGFELCK